MDKRIGKLFLLILFFNLNVFGASRNDFRVQLNALDSQGQPLEQAGAGVPFTVQVVVEGPKELGKPEILGTQKLKGPVSVSSMMSNNNGKVSTKKIYGYEAIVSDEGDYKIGPAQVVFEGRKINSNILDVHVGPESKSKGEEELQKNVFLKLSVDKNEIYVDQKINLSIKFYFNNDDVRLLNIETPDMKDFYFDQQKGEQFSGVEEIEGNRFNFLEYKYSIYPKKVGDILIPSMRATIQVPNRRQSAFMFMFSQMGEQKTIRSNTLKIKVKCLPKFDGTVNGVGNFIKFAAAVNQVEVTQGEGIVFRLELVGQAEMNGVKITKLNMPDEATYYDSRSYIEKSEIQDFEKKYFEFIVQPTKEGKLIIPEQEFTFFNPEKKKYQILKTQPIELNVKKGEIKKSVPEPVQKVEQETIQDEILPIYKDLGSKSFKYIPMYVFWLLVCLPFLINLIVTVKTYWPNIFFNEKRRAFKNTYKKLKICEKRNDCTDLYKVFIEFFAYYFRLNPSDVTQDVINMRLREKIFLKNDASTRFAPSARPGGPVILPGRHSLGDDGSEAPFDKAQDKLRAKSKDEPYERNLNQDLLNNWNVFFSKVVECSFSKSNNLNCEELIKESREWINLFKKYE